MKKIITHIFLLLFACPMLAQTEHQLTVSEIRQQTVVNEPMTLQKGYFQINSDFNYYFQSTNYFDNNWNKVPNYGYLLNTYQVPFSFSYGVTNNLEISMQTNYINSNSTSGFNDIDYYRPEKSHSSNTTKIQKGFYDLTIVAEYKLTDDISSLPSMGIGTYISVPYGKKEPTISDDYKTIYEATTSGYYELGIGYVAKKIFYPFSLTGFLQYTYSFPTDIKLNYSDTAKTHVNYGDYFNCKLTLNYMSCDWIVLGNTLSFVRNGGTDYGDNPIYKYSKNAHLAFECTPKITFQIKNFRLTQGIVFMLKGKNYISNPRAFVSLSIKI